MPGKRLILVSALLLVRRGSAACIPYQQPCNFLTAITCCGFPVVECLPNNNNATSCLLPLDLVNLSPSVTSFNPFAPVARDLEAAAEGTVQLAQDPRVDPLASPVYDPLANPMINPVINPLVNPLANPRLDPLVNPTYNPLVRPSNNN